MSHQRYPSTSEATREPHSVSLKVLRLARPSLVFQYPIQSPLLPQQPNLPHSSVAPPIAHLPPAPASLAYVPPSSDRAPDTNADPFILSPILSLPASFGSTYVGETFSCTLCANNEVVAATDEGGSKPAKSAKKIRDVRIDAEMKLPSGGAAHRLEATAGGGLGASAGNDDEAAGPPNDPPHNGKGVDLEPGETLQRIVAFHLKEKGAHVLAVTVSYYEATETSGRTRTFRKLYQFACKPALIVRTKVTELPRQPELPEQPEQQSAASQGWVLEAQLENCGEDVVQLDRILLETEAGLVYEDMNWEEDEDAAMGGVEGGLEARRPEGGAATAPPTRRRRPVLHPNEVEQICFVVSESDDGKGEGAGGRQGVAREEDGRIVLGVMSVGWKGEMGSAGFLSTGKLATRAVAG